MSLLTPKVDSGLGTNANTPGRSSSQSPRQVVPLVLGRGRVAVQWVTPVLRWHYRQTSTGQWCYFSAFGWIALGPVDEIVQLIVNDKPYYGVFAFRDSSPGDYVDLTIPKNTPEKFRFWWGLETAANYGAFIQALVDPTIAPSMVGKTHPNYSGIFTVAIQDMEAGQSFDGSTPPLPKIEVEFSRRSVSAFSFGYAAHGTHAIGTVKDILTTIRRGGRRLPASMFDDEDWTAKMQKLFDSGVASMVGTDLFISTVAAEAKQTDELVADVLSHFDGWLVERNGKLYVDWSPNDGSSLDESGLRVISEHELAEQDADEDPGDLDSIPSQVIVTGLDWTSPDPLSEASESAPVPFVQRLTGELREPEQINRAGFTARSQLKAYAEVVAAARANPDAQFTVQILRQYACQLDNITPLRVGDLFVLNLTQNGGKRVVVRIIERSSEDQVKVQYKCQRERGTFPQPAQPVLDPRVDPTIDPPQDLVRFTVAQLPPDLSDAGDTYVTPLIERPSNSVQSFEIDFNASNTWPGTVLTVGATKFAVAAVLGTALAYGFADVTIAVSNVGVDWGYLFSRTALEQANDSLLAVIGSEWFSIGTITPTGGGNYTLGLKRARLATVPTAHAVNDVLFIIAREDLIFLTNAEFANVEVGGVYNAGVATKWFKARPYGAGGVQGNFSAAFSLELRDPTPAAIGDLQARTGTGKIVQLSWTPITSSLVQEYHIYRATGPGFGDEAEIGQTGAENSRFYDTEVVLGTQYRYRLKVETTEEVDSDWSNSVTATPGVIAGTEVDDTPPANPGALTEADSGTYLGDDGTVYSYIEFNVPVAPAGAIGQTVKRRRAGTTGAFETVGQCMNLGGATTIRQDDLTPGTDYDFGLEAFSFSGATSALVLGTGSPYTAPGKTSNPQDAAGLAIDATGQHINGKLTGGTGKYACTAVEITWTLPIEKDIVSVEWRRHQTSNPVTGIGILFNGVLQEGKIPAKQNWLPLYRLDFEPEDHVSIRFNDSSGNHSLNWVTLDLTGHFQTWIGSIAVYDDSDVSMSGVKIGNTSASSVQQQKATYGGEAVYNSFSGTSPVETFTIDISDRGFDFKPDDGTVDWQDGQELDFAYLSQDAGSNASQVVIRASSKDGITNITTDPTRFSFRFWEN